MKRPQGGTSSAQQASLECCACSAVNCLEFGAWASSIYGTGSRALGFRA